MSENMRKVLVETSHFLAGLMIPLFPIVLWIAGQKRAEALGWPDTAPYSFFYVPLWLPPAAACVVAGIALLIVSRRSEPYAAQAGLLVTLLVMFLLAFWGIDPPEPPDGGPGGWLILNFLL
jgi:hypothetical protein